MCGGWDGPRGGWWELRGGEGRRLEVPAREPRQAWTPRPPHPGARKRPGSRYVRTLSGRTGPPAVRARTPSAVQRRADEDRLPWRRALWPPARRAVQARRRAAVQDRPARAWDGFRYLVRRGLDQPDR